MEKAYKTLVVLFLLAAFCNLSVEAKKHRIRLLSAREVYSILRDAGKEDIIPEGRFITHGFETDKELDESVPEAVVDLTENGRLLVSAAAINATSTLLEYMKHLNYTALLTAFVPTYNFTIMKPTLNLTALHFTKPTFNLTGLTSVKPTFNLTALKPSLNITALKPGLNITTLSLGLITTRSAPRTIQKEICFSSRSLNDIDDDDYNIEINDYDDDYNDNDDDDTEIDSEQIDGKEITETYSTGTAPTFETGYETVLSPTISTATGTFSDTPTVVSTTGTGTDTTYVTDTPTGRARNVKPLRNQKVGRATINCVVVQKPQNSGTIPRKQKVRRPQNVRKRQRVQSARKPQSVRKPQNIRKPQTTRKPQNTRRPQNTRKPQAVRRPQNVQRPQVVRRQQKIRQPQNIRKIQKTQRSQNEDWPQINRRDWFVSS